MGSQLRKTRDRLGVVPPAICLVDEITSLHNRVDVNMPSTSRKRLLLFHHAYMF